MIRNWIFQNSLVKRCTVRTFHTFIFLFSYISTGESPISLPSVIYVLVCAATVAWVSSIVRQLVACAGEVAALPNQTRRKV